jgi:predicted nucleic acid-binding protein
VAASKTSMPRERWYVYDTNVYIDAVRGPAGNVLERRVDDTSGHTWLAAVVAAELRAGVNDRETRVAVEQFVRRAARLGRLLVPTFADWRRAGTLLATLRRTEPGFRTKLRTLWNDALIAVTAERVGATVVTRNTDDFALLGRHLSVAITAP